MKVFTVFFLAHLIGDFYLQPQGLARNKSRSLLWTLLHSLIYAAVCMLSALLLGAEAIVPAAVLSAAHLVIDCVKKLAFKPDLRAKTERALFCADQALHVASIAAVSIWASACFQIKTPEYLRAFGGIVGMEPYRLLAYAALALAVMKPGNIFIRFMLLEGRPEEDEEAEELENRIRTGRMIGSLERLLVSALLALGQYGSIAIVFTAKSIARFKQLENRGFAEYYIYGTLLSAVTAVGAFLLLRFFGTL